MVGGEYFDRSVILNNDREYETEVLGTVKTTLKSSRLLDKFMSLYAIEDLEEEAHDEVRSFNEAFLVENYLAKHRKIHPPFIQKRNRRSKR